MTQVIEVIGILIATSEGKHAGTQDILDAVCHPKRIPRIGDQLCPRGGDPNALLGGDQFLAANGWKTQPLDRILRHGGCGSACLRGQDRFDTQSLSAINALRDARPRIPGLSRIRRARSSAA